MIYLAKCPLRTLLYIFCIEFKHKLHATLLFTFLSAILFHSVLLVELNILTNWPMDLLTNFANELANLTSILKYI